MHKIRDGYFLYELMTITFSALAIEAMVNAFGEKLIKKWEHFESSSPIAKLRIICTSLDISVDFQKEPWSTSIWLINFRNKVVHAKPEFIEDVKDMPKETHEKVMYEFPKSKLETQVSLGTAERALSAVKKIHENLCAKIEPSLLSGLHCDGCTGSIDPIE